MSGDWIIIAVIILVIGGFTGFIFWKNSGPPPTNRELALSCTTDMATQFHIHPHLEIKIDEKKQEIVSNIGVVDGCMNPLHTHDNTGEIHVESPEQRDFTLGDFFAVWAKPFNKNEILDSKADAKHIIEETVNGKVVQDYENTILKDGDQIVISYKVNK